MLKSYVEIKFKVWSYKVTRIKFLRNLSRFFHELQKKIIQEIKFEILSVTKHFKAEYSELNFCIFF